MSLIRPVRALSLFALFVSGVSGCDTPSTNVVIHNAYPPSPTNPLNNTLQIPVDDNHFDGNCDAGSFLTQDQADLITHNVFASVFFGLAYDAATCSTTGGP